MSGYVELNIDILQVLSTGKTKIPGSFKRISEVAKTRKLVKYTTAYGPEVVYIIPYSIGANTENGVITSYSMSIAVEGAVAELVFNDNDIVDIHT